jgi:hypothetical protein
VIFEKGWQIRALGYGKTYSVRLVQSELEPLSKRAFFGQIGSFAKPEDRKINRLAGAARVDIAGVASSILATPTSEKPARSMTWVGFIR